MDIYPDPNLTSRLIEYEMGQLDENATITLFQDLVNTGIIYSLQGSYQRMARALVDEGLVVPKELRG